MAGSLSPAHAEFGRRLRERRMGRGWTQETLAEQSGLHVTYVGGVERGQRNIALANILRLAEALEIDPSALVEGLAHATRR